MCKVYYIQICMETLINKLCKKEFAKIVIIFIYYQRALVRAN